MKPLFQQFCYNRVILPLLWGGSVVLSPFAGKLRAGLRGRRGLTERARAFRRQIGDRPLLLFHCASAGELEALKPLAEELDRQAMAVAISYFSPSARSALGKPGEFDFADYSPVDSRKHVGAYLDALRPAVIAITKHDVWPNFVWAASEHQIPLFLINGNFHSRSLKMLPGLKSLHRSFYDRFMEIMTVAEEDADSARQVAGATVPVAFVGDSRFDRVLARTARAAELPARLVQVCRQRIVIVAGSTHDVDEELLLPVIVRLRGRYPELLTVVVPHDPSPAALRRLRDLSRRLGLSFCDSDEAMEQRADVVVVNRTGILADLYRLGQIAFVGGGFGKGVHSVLEPMANALPVICGPRISVSNEARMARKQGFLQVVRGRRELEQQLTNWIGNAQLLASLREQARQFVEQHSGAAQRMAKRLSDALHGAITR